MEPALAQPRRNIIRVVITNVFDHLPIVAFLYLTFTVASSVYHSWGDAGTLAFVISSYANLVLLFWCFGRFEKLGPNSPAEKRERLKVAIWALATVLNLAFAWRVSGVMPLAFAVAIWSMATSVAVAGFYGLVIYKDS